MTTNFSNGGTKGLTLGVPVCTTISDDSPTNSTSVGFRAPSAGKLLFVDGHCHTGTADVTLKVNGAAVASAISISSTGAYSSTFSTSSFAYGDQVTAEFSSVSSAAGANVQVLWKPYDPTNDGTSTFPHDGES